MNVLFLCTGNSARSILAEALLSDISDENFRGYSAGSTPTGIVNPMALHVLEQKGIPAKKFRSKSWDEFAGPRAPKMDIIITVCDNAAGEVCPIWPGHPVTLHWGLPDPAAISGSFDKKERAFNVTFTTLEHKILDLLATAAKNPDQKKFLAKLAGGKSNAGHLQKTGS